VTSAVTYILLACGLAAVHIFAGKLRFLQPLPRSHYLSAAGGISVAYVFIHLLPEVTHRQAGLEYEGGTTATLLGVAPERSLFLVALAGFAVFYGLERLVVQLRRQDGVTDGTDAETGTTKYGFWLHMSSFSAYNALIGYLLLHRGETGLANLLLYVTAIGLHFVVNDHGLREHHERRYTHFGRWLLAGAVLVGVLVGLVSVVPEPFLSVALAFLAGSIVLNVIKEELPEERDSSFLSFGGGLSGYTALLLVV
jgi:zinc transporter ZupT